MDEYKNELCKIQNFMMPNIVWEINLGAISYHSKKASFNATANTRLTKLWASLRRVLQTNLGITKTKLLIWSQVIAILNPLSMVTKPLKNHYYAILNVCGTIITKLWECRGMEIKGNVLQKAKMNNLQSLASKAQSLWMKTIIIINNLKSSKCVVTECHHHEEGSISVNICWTNE